MSKTEATRRRYIFIGESCHSDQRLKILIISAATYRKWPTHASFVPEEKVLQRWRWVGTKDGPSILRRVPEAEACKVVRL